MLAGSRLRLALVLFGGLVLQTAVVPHFAVAGRIVDVMLLLAVCAGMLAGPERGATVGFFAGVGTDLIKHQFTVLAHYKFGTVNELQNDIGIGPGTYCVTTLQRITRHQRALLPATGRQNNGVTAYRLGNRTDRFCP